MTAPAIPPARRRDAFRLSQPDIAAQLVADIIHHRVEDVKRTREQARQDVVRRKQRHRSWYFFGAVPLLLGLTIWNVASSARAPIVFTPEERESVIRFQIYLAAQGVEAYRYFTGRWPADLQSVGMGDAGLVYESQDAVYAITDTSASVPLTYRRGDPIAPFAAGFEELKRAGRRGIR